MGFSVAELNAADCDHAVQIMPRIWWVGSHLPGDPFQCHVYLIEHGESSVLIDPGSRLTWEETRRKILEVVPLAWIRYFICQHQDPDITAIMPEIDQMPHHPEAVLLSHWRANALLKHYALRMPLGCVERMGWRLDLGGRELTFIFTPYLHFPGAFCTFDAATGTLFSSDLFGGFTENWQLAAPDLSIVESMRPFHEHYMPSREILLHGLSRLDPLPIQMIAPQHGSLVMPPLIQPVMAFLKDLDCGLYLMTRTNSDFRRLSLLNQMLREMMATMVLYRDFGEVSGHILRLTRPLLPVVSLEFFSLMLEGEEVVRFAPENGFRGDHHPPPPECFALLGLDRSHWGERHEGPYLMMAWPGEEFAEGISLVLPLFSPTREQIRAVVIFHLAIGAVIDDETAQALSQLSVPLGVAVERESIFRAMDLERQHSYDRSVRDPLTGLYNRSYMKDTVTRLCRIHDRDEHAGVVVILLDIDHFKSVNDTYGHGQGDLVLQRVAEVILEQVRSVDVPVRLGGEEFVAFVIGVGAEGALTVAERIRKLVASLRFEGAMAERVLTISGGLAVRGQLEPFEAAMERADLALYRAKRGGRNRVVVADGGTGCS